MVALIMAVTVFSVLFGTTPFIKSLVGATVEDNLNEKALDIMGSLLFAIIGALSGYIVGKDK